jgi:hypothetical protein
VAGNSVCRLINMGLGVTRTSGQGTWGPVAGSADRRIAGWPAGQIAGWPAGRIAGWAAGRIAG